LGKKRGGKNFGEPLPCSVCPVFQWVTEKTGEFAGMGGDQDRARSCDENLRAAGENIQCACIQDDGSFDFGKKLAQESFQSFPSRKAGSDDKGRCIL